MTKESSMTPASVTGVILAGGKARRMGGQDKGLVTVAGRPLVNYVIQALKPQVDGLVINANRNHEAYAALGYPVVSDLLAGYFGPLAGIASGMQAAETRYVVTAPCDSPFVPNNLVVRLMRALTEQSALIAVAHNGERLQPVFALLDCQLLPSLLNYLNSGGRKIDTWYQTHPLAVTDFADQPDTFVNINTPEEAEAVAAQLAAS